MSSVFLKVSNDGAPTTFKARLVFLYLNLYATPLTVMGLRSSCKFADTSCAWGWKERRNFFAALRNGTCSLNFTGIIAKMDLPFSKKVYCRIIFLGSTQPKKTVDFSFSRCPLFDRLINFEPFLSESLSCFRITETRKMFSGWNLKRTVSTRTLCLDTTPSNNKLWKLTLDLESKIGADNGRGRR